MPTTTNWPTLDLQLTPSARLQRARKHMFPTPVTCSADNFFRLEKECDFDRGILVTV